MQQIKKLLLPNKSEILIYCGLALIFLILNNLNKIWLYLGGTSIEQLKYSELVNSDFQNFIFKFDNEILPRFADFLIWATLGLIFFLIISLIKAFVDSAKEQITLNEYINRPKDAGLQFYVTKILIRVVSFVALIFWLYVFVFKLFPELSKLFFTSFMDFSALGLLWLIITVIFSALGFYIFAILIRFMMLKVRVFG